MRFIKVMLHLNTLIFYPHLREHILRVHVLIEKKPTEYRQTNRLENAHQQQNAQMNYYHISCTIPFCF